MEFGLNYLEDEELLIEFEVRGMTDRANREVTATLKESLVRKLEEEKEDSFSIPKKPHEGAHKSPRREIEICTKKLSAIRQEMVENLENHVDFKDWLPKASAKLVHIQGRASRVSKTAKFLEMSAGLREAVGICGLVAAQLRRGKVTSEQAKTQLEVVSIEMPVEGSAAEAKEQLASGTRTANTERIQEGAHRFNPASSEQQMQRGPSAKHEEFEHPATIPTFLPETIPTRPMLQYLEGDFENLSLGQPVEGLHSRNPLDPRITNHSTSTPVGPPSDAQVRREVKLWKARFQGLHSALSVDRFLAQIEWHAKRAQIPLDTLVGALDLCLEGEAYEWFWVAVGRNPDYSWRNLKEEMKLRFATNYTEDDVRRMLNSRKQQYPRESIQEFHQAIQRIALQSMHTIPDSAIYTIIRRNMRPGLQMKLHEEWNFSSLPEFIRRCSSLENLWRRFGHDPEAGLSSPQGQADRYTRPFSRPQVQFDRRPPKVHELNSHWTEPDLPVAESWDEHDEVTPLGDEGYRGDYLQQVCAMSQHLKARTPGPDLRSSRGPTQTRPQYTYIPAGSSTTTAREDRKGRCWNCNESSHLFQHCLRPVQGIFCFGCGQRDVVRTDCRTCNPPGNWRAEMRGGTREPHLGRSSPRPVGNTEETACNTDPELYRRYK